MALSRISICHLQLSARNSMRGEDVVVGMFGGEGFTCAQIKGICLKEREKGTKEAWMTEKMNQPDPKSDMQNDALRRD